MNKPELGRILKSAPVPERTGEYWEQFPKSVLGEIHRRETCPTPQRNADPRRRELPNLLRTWASVLLSRPALLIGAAAACVLFGFFLGVRHGVHSASDDPRLSEALRSFSEIATLVPNQVKEL